MTKGGLLKKAERKELPASFILEIQAVPLTWQRGNEINSVLRFEFQYLAFHIETQH
jgi:hypothetical protein